MKTDNDGMPTLRTDTEGLLSDLHNAVRSNLDLDRSIRSIIKKSLKDADLERHVEIRRDYDGVSSAEYLAEKMIGEMLAEGRINW